MADGAAANFVVAIVSICLSAATVLVFIPQKIRVLFLETSTRLAGQTQAQEKTPVLQDSASPCETGVWRRGELNPRPVES